MSEFSRNRILDYYTVINLFCDLFSDKRKRIYMNFNKRINKIRFSTALLADIIFWIGLVLSVIFIVWYIFGNSPSEFLISSGLMVMMLGKVWNMGEVVTKNTFEIQHNRRIMNAVIGEIKELKIEFKELKNEYQHHLTEYQSHLTDYHLAK